MLTYQDYIQKISVIVGRDISRGEFSFPLEYTNYQEAKSVLARIRTIQKELRMVKKEVGADISAIKSDFTSARTIVGKSVGAGIAAAFLGRRNLGRVNAVRRDDLRRRQVNAVEPYERIKRIIDDIVFQFDSAKGRIELSAEYQNRSSGASIQQSPQIPEPVLIASRFYIYISDQVKGPYTVDQLAALSDAGSIEGDTFCCKEGTEEWVAYSQVID